MLVLLSGALTFLTSLYLPWVATGTTTPTSGVLTVLSLNRLNGWTLGFGQAAGLLAFALAVAAAAEILSPGLARRLPLGSCAVAILALAALNAAQLRAAAVLEGRILTGVTTHPGAGAYLGAAGALIAAMAASVVRRDDLLRRPGATAVAAFVLGGGLIAAFLLPWIRMHIPRNPHGYFLAFAETPTIFAAAFICFGLPLWARATPRRARLAVAGAAAVCTGASLSAFGETWPYHAWLALGCSLGLVALALLGTDVSKPGLPRRIDAMTAAAGVLLVGALFLPWQEGFSTNGWSLFAGAMAGGLTVLLLALPGAAYFSAELALTAAIYVMTTAFQLTQRAHLAYGAPLGFAGAALLVLTAVRRLRVPPESRRLFLRLIPLAACFGFLAIPVATLTDRLATPLEFDSPWRLLWLETAAILVALHLLGRWLEGARNDPGLVLLPLALLALTALDLIAIRGQGISWEGWVSFVLCALLVVFGWIEQRGSLDRIRVPEVLRVDRLPEVEG